MGWKLKARDMDGSLTASVGTDEEISAVIVRLVKQSPGAARPEPYQAVGASGST